MSFRSIRALCAAVLALVLTGCVTPAPDASAPPPGEQETYVVLGVTPLNMRLTIVDGTVKNGVFSPPFIQLVAPSYMPDDDGYVVMKVKGNTLYGITSAIAMFGRQPIFGEEYLPEGATMVFEAPAGKVVYITSLTYERSRYNVHGMEMRQKLDLEAARAYLKRRYPQLADRLEQGHFSALRL